MSGTGNSSCPPQQPPGEGATPVEQHLGDRLAALVDGELGHDARERVLSHLATCPNCRREADAQRQLKSVFADTLPPPPSNGLLARLQGLPGGDQDGFDDPHQGGGSTPPAGKWPAAGGRSAPSGTSPLEFDYLAPSRTGGSPLAPSRGFGIHAPERSASRGRRFAFAAAGAFSLAALALGGALGSGAAGNGAVAGGDHTSAGPVRSATSPSGTDRDNRRRSAGKRAGNGAGAQASGTTRSAPSPFSTRLRPGQPRVAQAPSVPAALTSRGFQQRPAPLEDNHLLHRALYSSTPGSALSRFGGVPPAAAGQYPSADTRGTSLGGPPHTPSVNAASPER